MHCCEGRVGQSDAPREFLPYCSYGRERMKKFTSKVLGYEATLPLVLLTLGLYSGAAVIFSVISGFPFLPILALLMVLGYIMGGRAK
jgi:hypothetical protein